MAGSKKATKKRAAKKRAPKKPKVKRSWKPVASSPRNAILGATFRALRAASNLSIREMARRIGVSVNSVRWHEVGATMLRADDMLAAQDVFGCTVNDIFNIVISENDKPINAVE